MERVACGIEAMTQIALLVVANIKPVITAAANDTLVDKDIFNSVRHVRLRIHALLVYALCYFFR